MPSAINPQQLAASMQALTSHSVPPVETWNPPYCGELDIRIDAQGQWFYQGQAFTRAALVRLFASILKYEAGAYYLVTPAEKVKIHVEDVPFILVDMHWDAQAGQYQGRTQSGDTCVLDQKAPWCLGQFAQDPVPYIKVRANLYARMHRNLYYRLLDAATWYTGAQAQAILASYQALWQPGWPQGVQSVPVPQTQEVQIPVIDWHTKSYPLGWVLEEEDTQGCTN